MKLAIMQPYLFPYLGYFQLINAVDTFVVYDDVNYIKGGWINRNFILAQGEKKRITLQLQGAGPNVLINEVIVGGNIKKLLKTISQCYSKAPEYENVYPLVETILGYEEKNLSAFLNFSLECTCKYLGLAKRWYISSELQKDVGLKGQDKVLAICKELDAGHYINVPGGRSLYDSERFSKEGIDLSFINTKEVNYRQFSEDFIPSLSIVDIMMFNDKNQCKKLLDEYTLK